MKKIDWLPTGARAALEKKTKTTIRAPLPGQVRAGLLNLALIAKDLRIKTLVDFLKSLGMNESDADAAATEVRETPDAGDIVQGWTLSTKRVDSYKDTIDPIGWELSDFKRNPVVLFAHKQDDLPVGRDLGAFVDAAAGALKGVTRFTSMDLNPFGHTVGKLTAARVLNTTSVGFEPDEYDVSEEREGLFDGFFPAIDFKKQRLREYSVVPVPANPDALAEGRKAIDSLSPDEKRALISGLERMLDMGGEAPHFVPRSAIEAVRKAAAGNSVPMILLGGEAVALVPAPTKERRLTWEMVKDAPTPEQTTTQSPAEPQPEEIDDEKAPDMDGPAMCPQCGYEGKLGDFALEMPSEEDMKAASTLSTSALVAELAKRGEIEERAEGGGVDAVSPSRDPSNEQADERLARITKREVRRQITERTGRLP